MSNYDDSYETIKRKEMIKGLRELAGFIEANPDVPLPYIFQESVYINNTEYVHNPDAPHDASYSEKWQEIPHPEKDKAELMRVARVIGKAEKNYEADSFELVKKFSEYVQLTWYAPREAVCTKRVIGTKEIEDVTYERKVIGTKVVEEVEWDCDPLLKS